MTALHLAIKRGHLHFAKFLIENNPYSINTVGMTLLHIACLYGHLGVVKFLVKSIFAIQNVKIKMNLHRFIWLTIEDILK